MKGQIKQLILLMTVILLVTGDKCKETIHDGKPPLRFKEDHTFNILQITDLHYGESEAKDINTTALIQFLIKKSQADFVMITGDAVSGYAWDGKNQSFYQDLHAYLTSTFIELNMPYAFILGNHDAEANLNRDQIMTLDMLNPYSYSGKSEGISGSSNYWLSILSSYSTFESLHATHMWMFDTGDSGCDGNPNGWGCVEKDQINWYNTESEQAKLAYGNPLGLGWFHIPLVEYKEMYNLYPIYDWKREPICCPFENSGFFQAVFNNQNIQHMFCGHQHNNDFGGFMDGIEMGYGRKTGYGGYGPDIEAGELRGGRVFRLTENYPGQVSVEHSILAQDGTWISNTDMTFRADQQSGCIYFLNFNLFKSEFIEKKSYKRL